MRKNYKYRKESKTFTAYPQLYTFMLVGLLMTRVFSGEVMAQTASPPQRHVVQIQDFAFHPSHITVTQGDTVVWTNRDFVPHFVSLADGKWKSDLLEENQTWKLVVAESGFFHYVCIFHPEMSGEVMAQNPSAQTQTKIKKKLNNE